MMEKETRKNIWINARLILMVVVVIFLFSFSAKRNSERKIIKSEVIFVGNDELFITHETVNKLLIEKNQSVQKPQKVTVDLNKLENSLNNYNMIEKSEVFISIDGVLKAFVKQKSPVARVFDENGSFYFDYQGNKFDLLKYRDPEMGFISKKSQGGKELKALELPGLWNGSMAGWLTWFVDVPIETFTPVKTVFDLVRDAHIS